MSADAGAGSASRRRQEAFAGYAGIAAGILVIALVTFDPRGLRAPAWVAHAAGAAFILAGATLLARAGGRRTLAQWLPVAAVACLVAPAVWIAWGGGPRRCVFSGWAFAVTMLGRHSDLLCRLAFGVGAVVGLAILLAMARQAIRSTMEPW